MEVVFAIIDGRIAAPAFASLAFEDWEWAEGSSISNSNHHSAGVNVARSEGSINLHVTMEWEKRLVLSQIHLSMLIDFGLHNGGLSLRPRRSGRSRMDSKRALTSMKSKALPDEG